MCGINGIFGLKDSQKIQSGIASMNAALSHRGPDDEGINILTEDNIAIGHKRLSIIDLSSAGRQPMQSADGRYLITYNGEIYNFREIKKQLKEYPFQTKTDTEVILAAYAAWGKDCLHKLTGMFAFAIWDKKKKELFLARDRMGIKPLYYYRKDEIFVFSSELRSMLASGLVPKKARTSEIIDFLRYQTVHAPNTIIKDVAMLKPGYSLILRKNSCEILQYWKMEHGMSNPSNKSYKEITQNVNRLLLSAVEKRMISDVPFGAFLSGGIDSSVIVGLMSRVATKPVKTFSVVFNEGEFSEAHYSRMIAKKFNTEHHELKLSAADFIDQLPRALNAMDHPSGDGPNTYMVSKAAKESGITVALSGLGGDEIFAGYGTFKRLYFLNKQKWFFTLPLSLRKISSALLTIINPNITSHKAHEFSSMETYDFPKLYSMLRRVLSDEQLSDLTKIKTLPQDQVRQIVELFPQNTSDKLLSLVSLAESSTYMQNVLLRDTDQMSMANALEVRVPFLDHELIEFVLNIPDSFKYPHTPKKLLTDSVSGLLPPQIINRKKMGFVFPWKEWLKNELREFSEKKLSSLSERKPFNKEGVMNLWRAFLNNDHRVTWARVWMLIAIEDWLHTNGVETE